VILDDADRVLIARRPPHKHLGLKWEFPGGKVETDESPEHALLREIKEELGCNIIIQRPLPRFIHHYPAVVIEMIPFICTLAPGATAPHPHEHTEMAWVSIESLKNYDLAPADWPVLAQL
jgi:8-oxo-dGTP diphosphatase